MTDGASVFKAMHDAHAIEQLIAAIQFESPLSDDALAAGKLVLDGFEDELPGSHDLFGFEVQVGPNGVSPVSTSNSGGINGQMRFIMDPKGVPLRDVRLEKHGLAFRTFSYTRWDSVWGYAKKYFSEILSSISPKLQSMELQYVDKFYWTGPISKCRPEAFATPNSPYISPGVLGSEDLWHCYTGKFRRASNTVRRLEVVNIDCIDEVFKDSPRRLVRISTSLTDVFNQPGYDKPIINWPTAIELVSSTYEDLHLEQKRVLSEIINQELAKSVGLKENDDT